MEKENCIPSSKESILDEEYLPLILSKDQDHSET